MKFRAAIKTMSTETRALFLILDSRTLEYVKAYVLINMIDIYCLNWSFETGSMKFLVQDTHKVYFVNLNSDLTFTLQANLLKTNNYTESLLVQDLITGDSSIVSWTIA